MNKKVICKNVFGEEFKTEAENLHFRPGVYGIAIKDGKVLLSKQWDGYDFPGGGIELGETIKAALMREFKEETGFDVKVGALVTCEDSFYKHGLEDKYSHSFLLYYLCEITGGSVEELALTETEKEYVEKPEWIDLKEIGDIKFYNSIDSLAILKKAQELNN